VVVVVEREEAEEEEEEEEAMVGEAGKVTAAAPSPVPLSLSACPGEPRASRCLYLSCTDARSW
jgi:hypothetical protein